MNTTVQFLISQDFSKLGGAGGMGGMPDMGDMGEGDEDDDEMPALEDEAPTEKSETAAGKAPEEDAPAKAKIEEVS